MRSGISTNTARQYSTGQNHYIKFCKTLNAFPFPASELLLLRFVASLDPKLRGSTVQNYLSAVRSLHIMNGFPCPFNEYERLKLVVKALKKSSGAPKKRSPVTIGMLREICARLNLRDYNDVLLWAMMLSGFFGFLRVSEFTVTGTFSAHHDLSLNDLSLSQDLSMGYLQIKTSKCDPFREGCRVVLGATDNAVCPILALMLYLNRRCPTNGPLFKFADGRAVSRHWFCKRLKEVLLSIGVKGDYSSHSLRIGAATAAAAAGVPHATIQLLGRWSSDAYKLYIRMSENQKKDFSKVLLSSYSTF